MTSCDPFFVVPEDIADVMVPHIERYHIPGSSYQRSVASADPDPDQRARFPQLGNIRASHRLPYPPRTPTLVLAAISSGHISSILLVCSEPQGFLCTVGVRTRLRLGGPRSRPGHTFVLVAIHPTGGGPGKTNIHGDAGNVAAESDAGPGSIFRPAPGRHLRWEMKTYQRSACCGNNQTKDVITLFPG